MNKKLGSVILDWGKSIVLALVVVVSLSFFVTPTSVVQTSMYPTLYEDDGLLLYKLGSIDRGDIVTLKSNLKLTSNDIEKLFFFQKLFFKEGDRKPLIKRVIGIPGDKIDIYEGKVFINDSYIEESYIMDETNGEVHIEKIPEDKYFVLGDNRSNSIDSRNPNVGLIDRKDIIGKAIFRYWPLSRIRLF
ncbi:MAG: signal peptidase I [Clostridiales bacterium]|nr:MAG: signal peptidase I [Clostridiales bacterium]